MASPGWSAPKGKVKSLPLNPLPSGDELDAMPVVPSAEHSPLMADVERGKVVVLVFVGGRILKNLGKLT